MLRVAHVGLRVPDLEASVAFAQRILGLRVSQEDGDTVYLTCNERHHELSLHAGAAPALDHVAFEVDRERFAAIERRVAVLERGSAGVEDAFRFLAPGGLPIEVLHGMAHDQPRHYDSVAPRPLKFEHVTVKSTRKDELERVLIDVLGLRLSDRAEDAVSWLRASDEHHGVSVIGAGVDALHHYAWQFDGFAAFARIGDHLLQHGRTFLWGPGHHGIGDNYFCYYRDGDGAVVECSAGIARIEDEAAYAPRVWPDEPLTVNRWGNPAPPAEFVDAFTPLAVAVAA
jgi:catechol 2,3-dioxygenase-like lactoylglutathione lyase family enzyme